MADQELTLLSEVQILGNSSESPLEVIRKYGIKTAITDLCILTGGYVCNDFDYNIEEDKSLTGRVGWYWTKSADADGNVYTASRFGTASYAGYNKRHGAIRPVLQSSKIFYQIYQNRVKGFRQTEEVEYGEYPQNAADSKIQDKLNLEYLRGLKKTGRSYTFDSVKYDAYGLPFKPVTYEEYEYKGGRYICVKANSDFDGNFFKLSNGVEYRDGDYVWVEVSPVKWLIDRKTRILVSKKGLVSGIRFCDHKYDGLFIKTEMKEYLDRYMLRDLTQTVTFTHVQDMTPEERAQFEEEQKQDEKKKEPLWFKIWTSK